MVKGILLAARYLGVFVGAITNSEILAWKTKRLFRRFRKKKPQYGGGEYDAPRF